MVLTYIIHLVLDWFGSLISILPAIPAAPDSFVQGGEWIIDSLSSIISLIKFFFVDGFVAAASAALVAIIFFKQGYQLTMWILRKIPGLGIT